MQIFSTSSQKNGLRRAHSEELISEVGVVASDENNNKDNNNDSSFKTLFNDKADVQTFNGLQVSDRPTVTPNAGGGVRKRVRRNSAGDEISSILDHETSPASYAAYPIPTFMTPSPLATSETLEDSSGCEMSLRMAQMGISGGGGEETNNRHLRQDDCEGYDGRRGLHHHRVLNGNEPDLDRTSTTVTNSSLNTTVVTALEVSERYLHLFTLHWSGNRD